MKKNAVCKNLQTQQQEEEAGASFYTDPSFDKWQRHLSVRNVENCAWLFVSGKRLEGPKYASTTKLGEFMEFHSDTILKTVDRRALNNSKIWEGMAEDDISAR
ncbi:hypothetical protein TNCV_3602871 [Trichonephila clavipes]|nr:hypothetical protein TNCV_3602871 [Trichonephila clavipes]